MASRTDLQSFLENTLGSRNVYFQPPASLKMKYPAIVYTRSKCENVFADNGVFSSTWGYTVTVIDLNPDSEIVDRLASLPQCRFDRHFVSDNMNHDVFTLYY